MKVMAGVIGSPLLPKLPTQADEDVTEIKVPDSKDFTIGFDCADNIDSCSVAFYRIENDGTMTLLSTPVIMDHYDEEFILNKMRKFNAAKTDQIRFKHKNSS